MAFRPDTKYYIGSKEYDTIYEAFDAVRTMAKGTVEPNIEIHLLI